MPISYANLPSEELYAVQERFLKARAEFGNDQSAYKAAGISRNTIKKWREEDTLGFAERYRGAVEEYGERLEEILDQHIKALKPGQNILSIIFRLKAEKPWKYRDLPPQPPEGAMELVKALQKWVANTPIVNDEAAKITEGALSGILSA